MNDKAPLALMEQLIMVLVFALAAALCIQAFVKANQISMRCEERSNAALVAQDTAELIKYSGGDMGHALSEAGELLGGTYAQGMLCIDYDENWNLTEANGIYRLTAQGVPVDEPGLQKALVQVVTGNSEDCELLFAIEAAWLEVSPDE